MYVLSTSRFRFPRLGSLINSFLPSTLEIPSKDQEEEEEEPRRRRRKENRERASERVLVCGKAGRIERMSMSSSSTSTCSSSIGSSEDEDALKEKLEVLKNNVKDDHMFEEAVSSIKSLLKETYLPVSPSLQKYIYLAVCRVATILHRKKYTSPPPRFWIASKSLFKEAERLITNPSQTQHLKACIATVSNHLRQIHHHPPHEEDDKDKDKDTEEVFEEEEEEDHLEPSRPTLVVAHDLLATLRATPESSHGQQQQQQRDNNNPSGRASALMDELVNSMEEISGLQALEDTIDATLRSLGSRPLRAPPASKEVVAKLPIITITEEILARLGRETECAVCKENLVATDRMQELPCKHLLHLLCLEPWLDKRNSCPVCRHELPTDNQAYESWKEQEKEAILKKNETGDSCMFS